LREKGVSALAGFLAGQVGGERRMLLERPGLGRSEQFALIQLDQPAALAPTRGIVTVRILAAKPDRLIGQLAP
jgi:threonylcarbamoyladenosine tRNA methylthiotransferase MtaB